MAVFRRGGSTYYGYLILGDGKRRRVALTLGKEASEILLARMQEEIDREAAGLPREEVNADLASQLVEYGRHLAARGDTERHVKETLAALRAIVAGCGWAVLADLSADKLEDWLAAGVRLGWSPRTSNYHLAACKALARWLVERRLLPFSPFDRLRRLNQKVDERRTRRSLTPELFERLLIATAQSERVYRGLSGSDRFHLYTLAGYTGYRAAELASLTPAAFLLSESPPVVIVQARHSRKRKEAARQPLRPELAELFVAYLADRPATAPVWTGGWFHRAAEMLRIDLHAAGIPFADQLGEVFDFHGLRGQFITSLARAGVHPRQAQELARHSDINLTMRHYTKLHDAERAAAVNALPPPVSIKTENS